MIMYSTFIIAPGQCDGEPTSYMCILGLLRCDDHKGSEETLSFRFTLDPQSSLCVSSDTRKVKLLGSSLTRKPQLAFPTAPANLSLRFYLHPQSSTLRVSLS
ncbi:hypothetical protein L6452_02940 [Arctium lappa]|uniref:Uncharacterized protein n=1 Tax=Arctium lappa TaxID=4217 RepID=A0ACB9FKZ5_ARCLA|nr:hypothetical protein L6452_02940 [Arctium lappa]